VNDEEVNRLLEAFPQGEELHPELALHLTEDGPVGAMVHHPLVIDLIVVPEMYGRLNRLLAHKRERLAEAEAEGDWHTYVFLHERPYRLDALAKVPTSVEGYGELVGSVWIDSENIWQGYDQWCELLAGRPLMMDEDERAAFAELPDVLEVHRGYGHRQLGLSWTLDCEKAEWFARRAAGLGNAPRARVASGRVRKEQVIAYLTGRGEDEVVVFGDHVEVFRNAVIV
jgi:hypothetical protein